MMVRAVIRYGRERDAWPSARELARANPRLGSAATVARTLAGLRDFGECAPIRLVRRASESYWLPTLDGFAIVGTPPFAIVTATSRKARRSRGYPRRKRDERGRARRDAAAILDIASPASGKASPRSVRIRPNGYYSAPVYE